MEKSFVKWAPGIYVQISTALWSWAHNLFPKWVRCVINTRAWYQYAMSNNSVVLPCPSSVSWLLLVGLHVVGRRRFSRPLAWHFFGHEWRHHNHTCVQQTWVMSVRCTVWAPSSTQWTELDLHESACRPRSPENGHGDVIKWGNFPRYWPFVRGNHWSPVNSPHKGQWRGALIFSLISAWANGWTNNLDAGDLRRLRAKYDVIVMITSALILGLRLADEKGCYFVGTSLICWPQA